MLQRYELVAHAQCQVSHAYHDAVFLPEPHPHFDLAGLGKNCSDRSLYQNPSSRSSAVEQEVTSTGMGYEDKTESLARVYKHLDESISHFQAGHRYAEARSQAESASSKGAAFAVWLLLFLVFCLSWDIGHRLPVVLLLQRRMLCCQAAVLRSVGSSSLLFTVHS